MTGPGFDERYDPRFQRGYDAGADASGGTDAAGGTVAASGPEAEPAPGTGAPAPAAPASAAQSASTSPASASTAPASARERARDDAPPRASSTDAAVAGVDGVDEPGPEPDLARRWLWAAFGICAAAALVAIWLTWSSAFDRSQFLPPDRSAWAYLGAILQPVLLEFGLTGAALIGIWLGLRQRARSEDGLLRLPAVIGLAAGAAAAAVVLLWTGASVSPVVFWSGDPSTWTEPQRSESAYAELRMAVVGPAVRAGLVALAGIAVVGAAGAVRSPRPSREASVSPAERPPAP